MTQIAHTFGLRFFQVFESAGPTLVLGVLVAAVVRALIRPESVRRFFDAGPVGGVVRAVLIGAMLPVGALGVLPIALEFRRVGVPRRIAFAFAVAGPILNPLALSHALTSLGGLTILWTLAATALVCISIPLGLVRFRDGDNDSNGPRGIASSGGRRVVNLIVSAARISSGVLVGYVLLAAAATGAAAVCVDGHTLIHYLNPANPAATLLMTAVALPAYLSPAGGITLMHGMAAMRLSVGAGVAAYVFGVGQNAGLLWWMGKTVGLRRLLVFLLLSIGLVFAVGLIADAQFRHHATTLAHSGQGHRHEHDDAHEHEQVHEHAHGHSGCGCGGEEHNHALDALGRWETSAFRNPLVEAYRFSKPGQTAASILLAALLGVGVALRLAGVDRGGLPDPEDTSKTASTEEASAVSSRRVLLAALAYAAVMTVLGVYVYFPPTGELFTQMTFHRANAILATKHNKCDYAIRELDAWDALAAKCVPSATLRGAPPSGAARKSAAALRSRLAKLREAIVEGRSDEEKKTLSTEVMDAYSACRKAFREP